MVLPRAISSEALPTLQAAIEILRRALREERAFGATPERYIPCFPKKTWDYAGLKEQSIMYVLKRT